VGVDGAAVQRNEGLQGDDTWEYIPILLQPLGKGNASTLGHAMWNTICEPACTALAAVVANDAAVNEDGAE
jgi:hypothetical protein